MFQGCSVSTFHTERDGQQVIKCLLHLTVDLGGTGCSGCSLRFSNPDTGSSVLVEGVLHWAYGGNTLYFYHDDLAQFETVFAYDDYINVSRADFGKPASENLALAYVFGVDAEYSTGDKNGLKYMNSNSRVRLGRGGSSRRDYTVWTINPMVRVHPGDTLAIRHYLITDQYEGLAVRADSWVQDVHQEQFGEGDRQGRQVLLFSADDTVFGATINSSACGRSNVVSRCAGSTTPQAGTRPLYAIRCGAQRYVGADLYHFAPIRANESDPIQSYVCRDAAAGTRPEIALLGWFNATDCLSLRNASFDSEYCLDRQEDGLPEMATKLGSIPVILVRSLRIAIDVFFEDAAHDCCWRSYLVYLAS